MVWLSATRASPIDYLLSDDSNADQSNSRNDFEMRFDQRQNGTENFRLRVDGVLIAFPSAVSSSASSIASAAAADYLLELAAAVEDDDNDTDNYFNFLKNPNDASASEAASMGGNKNTQTPAKDEKLAIITKEGEMKRVVIVAENEEKESERSSDLAKQSSTLEEGQVKLVDVPVVPVKKVQSRRRNK